MTEPRIMIQDRRVKIPVRVACGTCGMVFRARPAKVKAGLGRFCSLSCSGKHGSRVSAARAKKEQTEMSGPVERKGVGW
jgi:hypothetical protein